MSPNRRFPWRLRLPLPLAALCLVPVAAGAKEIVVPAITGATNAVQEAVDQCPDQGLEDCRIVLQGTTYELANTLMIRNKKNLVLTGASAETRPVLVFQDDGTKAGPDSDPDSLALKPAGWKKWPNSCGTAVGGSLNTSNPFSTSGIQRNGVVLVQGSRNVTLDGLVIDGLKPIGWGKGGIWNCSNGVWYGNFGVNLYLSGQVTIRNCEIRNCFAGIYGLNRNKGAALAVNNPNDLDKGLLVPGARQGEMGGHLVEANLIHDNIWGAYLESNWDLGSTWRFNRVWNCHNTASTYAAFYATGISEAMIHTGGFLFLKDAVGTPERVYNNTFWHVSALFGDGGWRGNAHHWVYSNLVADPWLDYKADTSGYLGGVFSTAYLGFYNSTWKTIQFLHANTFVPPRTNANGTGNSWEDTSRLLVLDDSIGGIRFLTGISYQGDLRGIAPKAWSFEQFDYKSLNAGKILHSVATQTGEVFFKALDTAKVLAVVGGIADGSGAKLPVKDTLGRILAAGLQSIAARNNHYIRGVAFQSTNSLLPTFLAPTWSDSGVDSVVAGRAMQLDAAGAPVQAGGYAFRTGTGAVAARGAIQPDGRNSGVQLELDDRRPAVLAANELDLRFDLKAGFGPVSDLKVLKACLYEDVNLADDGATQDLGACREISVAGFTPKLGSNRLVTLIGTDPGFNSRFELMIGGKDASGAMVLANPGVWFLHKAESRFEVSFRREKTDADALDSIKVGELVWMRLRPFGTAGLTVSSAVITDVTIHAQFLQTADGASIESSVPFLGRMQGDTSIQVRFARAAAAADVLVSGVDATKAVFQGAGSLAVTSLSNSVKERANGLRTLRRQGQRLVAELSPGDLGKRWQLVRADGSLVSGGIVAGSSLELPRLRGAGWLKVGTSTLPVTSF